MNSYIPRHRVTIKRAANGFAKEDISADVRAISTSKGYGNPLGTFTIVTTFNQRINNLRYDQVVKPNDIVLIELDKGAGKGLQPVMLGLFNAPERVLSFDEQGRPFRTCHLSGYDFGKILTQHHCKWFTAPLESHVGSEDSIEKVQYGATLVAGGTPNTIVNKILEVELFEYLEWTKTYITTDLVNSSDAWQLPNVVFSYHDTIWEVMAHYSNKPYNMLHCDTGPNKKFNIILEKCPFDNSTGKLERTEFKTIDPVDVITYQLGLNDHDRYNYIYNQVQCGMFAEPGSGTPYLVIKGDAVKYDESSVLRHGFRPWIIEGVFVPFNNSVGNPPQLTDQGDKPDVKRAVKERTDAFWNWNKNNQDYESGTLALHGDPDLRSGDAAIYLDNKFEYFVQQVNHAYSVFPTISFKSALHLTRGQKHANN